jgi:hypothetical protein
LSLAKSASFTLTGGVFGIKVPRMKPQTVLLHSYRAAPLSLRFGPAPALVALSALIASVLLFALADVWTAAITVTALLVMALLSIARQLYRTATRGVAVSVFGDAISLEPHGKPATRIAFVDLRSVRWELSSHSVCLMTRTGCRHVISTKETLGIDESLAQWIEEELRRNGFGLSSSMPPASGTRTLAPSRAPSLTFEEKKHLA